MTTARLLIAEIGYRRMSFVLCVLAVVVAATLFVAGPMLISAYSEETSSLVRQMRVRLAAQLTAKKKELDAELGELRADNQSRLAEMQKRTNERLAALDKETKKAMRDLGFNLNILHKDTTMGALYVEQKVVDMPEEYIHRLANAEEIDMIRHLVATLQDKIKWNDRTALLVGFLPEAHQSHMTEKPDMVNPIESGTVIIGHELAASVKGSDGPLKQGDTIRISGPGGEFPFKVAQVLPQHGSQQDVTFSVHLHDAQKILGKSEKISQIMALGCHCDEANLPNIREKLGKVLPDTNITEHRTRRIARAKQRDAVSRESAAVLEETRSACQDAERQMNAKHAAILKEIEAKNQRELEDAKRDGAQIVAALSGLVMVTTPLVVIASAAFVALMLWNNVRERRQEIAVLRAIGKGAGMVASLFLGKAIVLGVLGGVLGCLIGYAMARIVGLLLKISPESFDTPTVLLVGTLLGTPIIAVLASYVPTLFAVRQDPAMLLQDH
jgi:ABC-type lipoprotein release transport system permease subunit